MLAYKLREATRFSVIENRDSLSDPWVLDNSNAKNIRINNHLHRDGLKTPYSDEINLGVQQRFANTQWTLKWVQRHGRKQFGSESINGYTVLNNAGFSKSNTFTLKGELLEPWDLKHAVIRMEGGINYSRNKTNADTYEESLNEDELGKTIVVNGKVRGINDKPETEYSNPWRVFADITTRFPDINLTWTNSLNYTAGYTAWDKESGIDCAAANNPRCGNYKGGKADLYTKVKFSNAFTLDWHFGYDIPVGQGKKLTLNADITNVLDNTIKTKKSSTSVGNSNNVTYKLGRQFWLGGHFSW